MSGRKRICILFLAAVLCLSGCGSLNFTSAEAPEIVSFDGSSIGDRTPNCTANPALADQLRAAIMAQTDASVQGWALDTVTACLDELMALPEYFWFRGYHISATTGLRTTADVSFTWLYEDGPARYDALCRKADEILAAAPWAGDYSVALYVYEWLIRNVTYADDDGFDQTAYAAICEGAAVCGGIADAFAFLLCRAGIPACTVTGSAVQDGETLTHAWNFAELDGAVYAFDLTWDNTDLCDASGTEYVPHNWFAVTSRELNTAHTARRPEDEIAAVSNADNFFIREGALVTDDSVNAVVAALEPQLAAGRNTLSLRCADRAADFVFLETAQMRFAALTIGMFDKVFRISGKNALAQEVADTGCADFFYNARELFRICKRTGANPVRLQEVPLDTLGVAAEPTAYDAVLGPVDWQVGGAPEAVTLSVNGRDVPALVCRNPAQLKAALEQKDVRVIRVNA